MKAKHIKLARKQLDETLKQLRPLVKPAPPVKGWVRAIRDALGMKGEQLAGRLNTNKQRISRIEKDELSGNITISTMRNVAQAMDCKFVYALVPTESLEQTVKNQAAKLAGKQMSRSNQTMMLEKQQLNEKEKQKSFESLVEQITDSMPRTLWDE
jgi:predicted DNA-binding mobile mystery protein A